MIGITDTIPEHDERHEMHRLIAALLSSELKEKQKLDIIEKEYNIPISNDFREEVRIMCNLSEGIEERATEDTTRRIIINMFENKFSAAQIALATGKNIDEIERIIEKDKLVLV